MSEQLAELKKLRIIQLDLEKNINFIIENLKDPSIGLMLLKQTEERNVLCKNAEHTTLSIEEKLKEIKNKLTDEKYSDYEQLKLELVNVEENIKNSKEEIKQYIEDLIEEETSLGVEITNISKRLKYNDAINLKSKLCNNKSVSKEIQQFSKFVCENNGEELIWNRDAQKILFDVTRRFKCKEKVLETLKTLIQDLSEESLKMHEDCYDQYIAFCGKKNETLKKWSDSKQKQEFKKEELELQLREKRVSNFIRTNPETRQKILLWKTEKKIKKIQEQELKVSYENKQRESDKLKRCQQEKAKHEIDKWKLERQSKLEHEEISKTLLERRQQQFKSKLANKLIKEYQQQDEMHVKKILDDRQKRTNVKPLIIKKNIAINRNPEDFMKPTKQWLSRTEINTGKSIKEVIPISENINKLGVPDWRKTSN